jgi:Putative peptidoglycan binding domain
MKKQLAIITIILSITQSLFSQGINTINIPNAKVGKFYAYCFPYDSSQLKHFSIQFIPQSFDTLNVEIYPQYHYFALKKDAKISPVIKGEIISIEPPKFEIITERRKFQNGYEYWANYDKNACLFKKSDFCFVLYLKEKPNQYSNYQFHRQIEPAKIIRQRVDTTIIEILDSSSNLIHKVIVPAQYIKTIIPSQTNLAHFEIQSNTGFTEKILDWHEVTCSTITTNNSVINIQKALNEHGFNLELDNIMGIKTKKAIKDFQKKNGLQIGHLNVETLKALGIDF